MSYALVDNLQKMAISVSKAWPRSGRWPIGRQRVRRMKQSNQRRSVWRRNFIHNTDSKHAMPMATNVQDGQFATPLV